jgi:putative oxidoreductase
MIDPMNAPYAVLLLRVALGVLFIAHASLKLFVFKPAGTMQYFASLGLPGWVGIATIVAEYAGAACLILGIVPRWAAAALVPLMLGTIFLVHGKNGWAFTNKDGGWEYPAFWAVALVVVALAGDGAAAWVPSSMLKIG